MATLTAPGASAPLIELAGIGKWFGGVHAVSDVSVRIEPGTIHAIVGENGAGKSTLGKVLSGSLRPDQGEIRLTTDPHFRGKGLGTMLAQEIIDVARDLGLELLSIEIAPELYEAFSLSEKLGFTKAAVLKGFIIDLDGNETDLILMTKHLNAS